MLAVCAVLVSWPGAAKAGNPVVDMQMLSNLQADLAQKAGIEGRGITVGVISTGIAGYQAAEASGALPSSIEIVQGSGTTQLDEGVAMLEVIHQVAPAATLAYCDALNVPGCAQALVQQFGATVVVDDAVSGPGWFSQNLWSVPYDQTGEANPSVVLIHIAGNSRQFSFYGPFTPVTESIGGVSYQVENFAGSGGGIWYDQVQVPAGGTLYPGINWNASLEFPVPASNDVMGLWVLSQSGAVLASGQSNAGFVSGVQYTNTSSNTVTVNLVVGLITQNNPGQVAFSLTSGELSSASGGYTLAITSGGDAGEDFGPSTQAVVVGATGEGASSMEPYSEVGATMVYWDYSPTGGPGNGPLYIPVSPAQIINHPDLTGVDCVTTAVTDFTSFCGTSAAAPTVAGVVALMMSAGFNKVQILNALEATAKPVAPSGATSTGQTTGTWNPNDGFGLVQTWDALLDAGIKVPSPAITSPSGVSASITAGQSLSFAGNCIAPSGEAITGYTWNFGNGQSSTSQNPGSITFPSAGTDTVSFNCTSNSGIQNPQPATFTVNVAAPPSSGGGGGKGGGAFSILGLIGLLALLAIAKGRQSPRPMRTVIPALAAGTALLIGAFGFTPAAAATSGYRLRVVAVEIPVSDFPASAPARDTPGPSGVVARITRSLQTESSSATADAVAPSLMALPQAITVYDEQQAVPMGNAMNLSGALSGTLRVSPRANGTLYLEYQLTRPCYLGGSEQINPGAPAYVVCALGAGEYLVVMISAKL